MSQSRKAPAAPAAPAQRRRRGSALAAGALGVSLLLSGTQAVPPVATAQEEADKPRSEAEQTEFSYRDATVRPGGEARMVPRGSGIGPNEYRASVNMTVQPGWSVTVNGQTGVVTASVVNDKAEGFTPKQEIAVFATFGDGSTKTLRPL
ncbi:Rib/alpha-like domain-containing protein [Corynebacterium sp. Marseille-P4321]|uniref:Rib/alpha-like domain-containing protein n=1 Tax=Corynebacterium sp. Marseille-P4321 TaxID=2736603 RepID=UPI00158EF5E9|nr:Rib/alpha-like domain-containing protein [Corynebacterium sp. Marseille-P4321]